MLSPKAAAARLCLSVGRVRQLIASGALRATNIGIDRPLWAIEETELARFAALNRPGHRPRKDRTIMYHRFCAETREWTGTATAELNAATQPHHVVRSFDGPGGAHFFDVRQPECPSFDGLRHVRVTHVASGADVEDVNRQVADKRAAWDK